MGDLLSAELGSHPSQVWRALWEGKSVLKQGLIRRIGNGRSTNIWADNWLPRDNMLRALHPRSNDPPSLVAELMDETTRSWNHAKVHQHMQRPDVDIILNIPLSSRNLEDEWAWHYERSGICTVRSCYRLLVDTKRRREDWLEGRPAQSNTCATMRDWSSLWKIKVPGKIKSFAWRLARNSIPTEAVRCHRNMADESVCLICNGAEDTWSHALIDCNMAKSVWSLVDEDLVDHMIACRTPDARLWLMQMKDTMSEEEFIKVLVTMWSIWWARRRAIHENEYQSPLTTYCFITRYLEDLTLVPGRNMQCRPAPVQRSRQWKPPPQNFFKFEVDAAVSKNGNRGTLATICRDHRGMYCGSSAVVIEGMIQPEVLEAMAVREAFALADDLYVKKLHITTDCIATTTHLRAEYRGPSAVVINDIKEKLKEYDEVQLEHEGRESNIDAHILAKASVSLILGRHVWLLNPPDFTCIQTFVLVE